MKRCSHDGCDAELSRRNNSGLCRAHYDARRREAGLAKKPRCATKGCGRILQPTNKSGHCISHWQRAVSNSARKTHCDCGVKLGYSNTSGQCWTCLYPASALPDDLREVYDTLLQLRNNGKRYDRNWLLEEVKAGRGQELLAQHKRLSRKAVRIVPKDVIEKVCRVMEVSPRDVTSKARFRFAVEARMVCAKIMHDAGMSYNRIAYRLGATDHTSAIHWVKRYDACAARFDPIIQQVAA